MKIHKHKIMNYPSASSGVLTRHSGKPEGLIRNLDSRFRENDKNAASSGVLNPSRAIKISRSLLMISVILFGFIGIVATGGGGGTDVPPKNDDLDIEPFIEYAEASDCTDIRNRLFIIDDELVLWDRVGNCPDNSYEVQFFKEDLNHLLCETRDSIAGPQTDIYDEDYRDLFETILDNIEDEDLGIGDSHLVEEVIF